MRLLAITVLYKATMLAYTQSLCADVIGNIQRL